MDNFEQLLKEGAQKFSVDLDQIKIDKLLKYKELLLEWNKNINLTAIEDDREVIIKHFIDSLSVTPYIKDLKGKIIDVGTGAGFPGIPIKVASDNVEVVLLDSLEKRVNFLNTIINQLSLERIRAVHGRAEELGNNPAYRECFDISIARAVASLPVLLEYCLPFVKTGGIFIAMKGSSTDEIAGSNKALDILGGKIEQVEEFVLPFSDIRRSIIIVRKYRQTPTKYPRKPGKPSKEPLI